MRKFTCFIACLVSLPLVASDYLYVRQKSGDTKIALSAISHITFPKTGGVVICNADGTTNTYADKNLYSLRFNNNVSGLESAIENTDVIISNDGNLVTVNVEGAEMVVYALDGAIVAQGSDSSIEISHLQSGLYIVKAGCVTTKIVKK